MEKIKERQPEPEPIQFNRRIEETQLRIAQEEQRVAALPRVLKPADIPWSASMQAALSRQWISSAPADRLSQAPIRTMAILEQILQPNMIGGRHRHVREAIFYVIEGEGYEIHDGKRYDWSAGDVMTVPSYCDHQHFNLNPQQKARMWYSISPVVEFMGIHWIEQIAAAPFYRTAEEAKPCYGTDNEIIGWRFADGREFRMGFSENIKSRIKSSVQEVVHIENPGDTYENYLKLLEDEVRWRQSVPHVIRSEDIPWENTRMGRIKFLVTPSRDCGLKTYDSFLQELPPGGSSGKHRHAAEEVHKILQGKGFDVHDGARHSWEVEDVVCIPPYVEHQHFNGDSQHAARFIAFQSRWYTFLGHGGIDHLEDALDFRGHDTQKSDKRKDL